MELPNGRGRTSRQGAFDDPAFGLDSTTAVGFAGSLNPAIEPILYKGERRPTISRKVRIEGRRLAAWTITPSKRSKVSVMM